MKYNDLVIIACSNRKLKTDTAVPAIELYQGQLFKAHVAYSRHVLGATNDRILILSAKYALVPSDTKIHRYDKSLDEMPAEERGVWEMVVAYALGMYTGSVGKVLDRVYVMGGKFYRLPIQAALAGVPTQVIFPHPQGLGYAQQVAWYTSRVREAGAEVA